MQPTPSPSRPAPRPWPALLFCALMLALGLWNLSGPAMWWDEGWTLSVARSWVEQGHYGRLLLGAPAPPGLEASPTTTVPVALIMRLLGVGIWQGRLFGVICMVAALLLLAALGSRLYGRAAGRAAPLAALLLSAHPQLSPLLQGRQVLAELPMLCLLLAGYLCLGPALAGRALLLLPASLLFGLAWVSKGQTAPFLLASLLAPALAALLARRWRVALACGAAAAGAYLASRGFWALAGALLYSPGMAPAQVSGLLEVMAVVTNPFNRIFALRGLLLFGLPVVLGALWAARLLWRERAAAAEPGPAGAAFYLRLAVLALVGGWAAWFALLSVGVPRYFAPPAFVGAIFVAVLLRDLTGQFDLGGTMAALASLLGPRRRLGPGLAALLVVFLSMLAFGITCISLARYYPEDDRAAERVAALLNARPPGTVVETYESEIHFLLDQPYHYPPDQTHVELNRRSLLGEEVAVAYDPLAADPDYLVVGRFSRENGLYEEVLAGDDFRLVLSDGLYELYERVR